jgi:glycosyltransferase involved in cell wall biosynthesis
MNANRPLLSVIIPACNAARFLPEAVASVRAQGYSPIEVLIVDDGSTDNTAEVAGTFGEGVRCIRQANAAAAARNRGLTEARGELVAFLDADDLWPADKLRSQALRLAADPALDVVLGRVQYQHQPGVEKTDIRYEGPDDTLVNVHLGSGLYRRSVFDKVGVFDEKLRFSEDHDWFLRAREAGARITILEQVTLYYRLHGKNMTHVEQVDHHSLIRVLKASLDRRRMANEGRVNALPRFADCDEANRDLVSCIIPAFNAERYLAEAVRSALDQSWPRKEVIIVDDGSSDRTADVARSFGPQVLFYSQPHTGAGAARNRGVEMAKGAYLAFLDADDVWPPERLGRMMATLAGDPALDLTFGHVLQFHSPDLDAAHKARIAGDGTVMPGRVTGAMLVRRESFLRAGPFPTEWRVGEFMDWYLRAREKGLREAMVAEVVLKRRLHRDNLGIRERASRSDYARIVKNALDRRRKGAT